MREVLRAVDGLAPGLVFDVGERVTLGRSAVSDVQLAHPDVSRFHAIIERDVQGRTFITDLASKAGVVVDGNRVQRAVLRRGTLVQICHFSLRYDTVDDGVRASRPAKITGAIVVSSTRETPRAPITKEVPTIETMPTPVASASLVMAQVATGAPPELLELVRDVMEYRVLAADGVPDLSDPRGERLQTLRERFDIVPSLGAERPRRAHHRFARTGPVLLGIVSGTETRVRAAQVVGLGAGGAGVAIDDPPPADAQCWLLVATGDSERGAIGFPARVAWSNRNRGGLGLAFIGRPIEGPELLPPTTGH